MSITAKDSKIINYPLEDVYRTLTDFHSYPRWYPKPFKIDILHLDSHATGTTISIENGKLVKWTAKISDFKPNKLIAIDYIDGAWLGKTFWRFEGENGKTKVTLEIDLEINSPWLRSLSKIMNFSKVHSKQMQQVFNALELYMGKKKLED
ncbi:MAG: hypothetical protein EHM58_13440 [Ignavibacteriae bacterium]|nr:MAG: hypothetical protein EHM58_13440 [Ignavibacteriota bacterium]